MLQQKYRKYLYSITANNNKQVTVATYTAVLNNVSCEYMCV